MNTVNQPIRGTSVLLLEHSSRGAKLKFKELGMGMTQEVCVWGGGVILWNIQLAKFQGDKITARGGGGQMPLHPSP